MMSEEKTFAYWEDMWTGERYCEINGKTYLIYEEDGWMKLKEVQTLEEE